MFRADANVTPPSNPLEPEVEERIPEQGVDKPWIFATILCVAKRFDLWSTFSFSPPVEGSMKYDRWLLPTIAVAVASGMGILIAVVDRAAPFGDDSSQFTVFLWLVSSGLLGFVMPGRPWRWAVLV